MYFPRRIVKLAKFDNIAEGYWAQMRKFGAREMKLHVLDSLVMCFVISNLTDGVTVAKLREYLRKCPLVQADKWSKKSRISKSLQRLKALELIAYQNDSKTWVLLQSDKYVLENKCRLVTKEKPKEGSYSYYLPEGGYVFRVRKTARGGDYLAEAKRETEPFVTDDILTEPGDLWFEHGTTEEEALRKLKATLFH